MTLWNCWGKKKCLVDEVPTSFYTQRPCSFVILGETHINLERHASHVGVSDSVIGYQMGATVFGDLASASFIQVQI